MQEFLEKRERFCHERLEKLRDQIGNSVPKLQEVDNLCIYVTGSFGRLEASKHSDLDIFFIHKGSREENKLAYITKALIDADLVRLCDKLGFPEFTGGGEYLDIHYLQNVLETLGSPKDDYENYFTARLLLLLESRPLYDDDLYKTIIRKVVNEYYRDFSDHEEEFQALFLVNDIIRFWRTLCLNYEYKRNPARDEATDRPTEKDHRKNLKLKYSRLLTCFSAILPLVEADLKVSQDQVLDIVQTAPLDRIRKLDVSGKAQNLQSKLLDNYAWFLDQTNAPKKEQLEWIADPANRTRAFEKAQKFGDDMFKLLKRVGSDNEQIMRYLVI